MKSPKPTRTKGNPMKSTLDQEQVKILFASCAKECDVLIGLLNLAIPNWDQVEYIFEGKPRIGEEGWRAIYDLFRDFNEDHPGENMFPGGLWLSMGFSMDKNLEPWEVDVSDLKIIMKTEP
jgi:hypothetical protein